MQEPHRVKSAALWQPPLQEIAAALQEGLTANYRKVAVTVEPCPDLRDWGCTTPGMSGNARILDVGGEAYAHNRALFLKPDYSGVASVFRQNCRDFSSIDHE